jgi:predicted DNA-binding transcriptional regulator AlpA
MNSRELYSIKEARELLGGISRNSIYELLRSGRLPSVVLGCRRFMDFRSECAWWLIGPRARGSLQEPAQSSGIKLQTYYRPE